MTSDSIKRDIGFGLRGLRKNGVFALLAIGTLAIGIGLGTAILSAVSSVLLEALPYPEPDRIVMMWERGPKLGSDRHGVNRLSYLAMKEEATVFSEVGYFWHMNYITLEFMEEKAHPRSKAISGRYVSPSLFSVLNVEPLLGRTFDAAEDIHQPQQVAVISYRLWQRRFNGDSSVLGEELTLENYGSTRTYSVVGVMPPGFSYPGESDLWLPAGWFRPPPRAQRDSVPKGHDLFVVARLKPGISVGQARAEINALQKNLAKEYPNAWVGSEVDVTTLREELFGSTRLVLLVLVGCVGAVLFLACTNLANLLLFRATARRREMAIRASLGAGRGRILRQLMTEALVLVLIGGLLGGLLAHWGVGVLERQMPAADSAESDASIIMVGPMTAVQMDGMSLTLVFLLMGSVGIVFGLVPVFVASKSKLTTTLNESAKSTTRNLAMQRLQGGFLAGQITVTLTLLIAAVMAIQSFSRLVHLNPGFEAAGLLAGHVDFGSLEYSDRQTRVDHSRMLLERLEALPGVVAAAGIHELPLQKFGRWRRVVKREDQTLDPASYWPNSEIDPVTPHYFRTMQIPLLRGRDFTLHDENESDRVAILNQKMVDLLWPDGDDPIGKRISVGLSEEYHWLQYRVVGIVGNSRSLRLDRDGPAITYIPFAQIWPQGMSRLNVVVRTESDPVLQVASVRGAADSLDARFPIHDLRVLENDVKRATGPARFLMSILGMLGMAALVFSAMGVYGVVSYYVERGRSEIGLRMALGAGQGEVIHHVLAHGLRFTLVGIVPGLFGAWAICRVMQGLLYDTPLIDPLLFGLAAAFLILVACASCWVPAMRAARVDPIIALRAD